MPKSSRLVMGSHVSPHWPTPQKIYESLHSEFSFTLDPCPLHGNEDGLMRGAISDGLALRWDGERVYCNPPYGPGIDRWLRKAREADVAVYLLPARTDTKWWHEYALKADEIRFVRGRLRFEGATNPAPFPSVILIFRGR
jgi:site-specific DNA-methyltransferase (adenine-specific)